MVKKILHIKDWIEQRYSEYETMRLDESNIDNWKYLVNNEMYKYAVANYTDHLYDEQWLECYTGMTPHEAVQDELDSWNIDD